MNIRDFHEGDTILVRFGVKGKTQFALVERINPEPIAHRPLYVRKYRRQSHYWCQPYWIGLDEVVKCDVALPRGVTLPARRMA